MDNLPYSRFSIIGLGLTVAMMAALAAVTFLQPARMRAAADEVALEARERGEEIYLEACADCHGEHGEGNDDDVPPLNKKEYLTSATDEIIFNVINDGRPGTGMPAWGQNRGGPYNTQAIDDLVAFIRAWESNAPSLDNQPYEPDLTRGRILFSNTCFACHGVNGEGTNVAPALNDAEYLAKFDDDYFRTTIRRGRAAQGMPTWGTVLSPDQIEDLVAHIRNWETATPADNVLPGGDVRRGQALFGVACASCHGINGFGTNLARQPLSRPDYLESVTDRQMFDLIAYGSGTMPGWGEVLSPAEIGDLVAYIHLLPPPPAPDELVGDIANGARLYITGCTTCHGPSGEGIEGLGPPLRSVPNLEAVSDEELQTTLLEGVPHAGMPPWQGALTNQEVADLIALLRDWQQLSGSEATAAETPEAEVTAVETPEPEVMVIETPEPEVVIVETPELVGDLETGIAIFTSLCARCHGEEAEGLEQNPALRQSENVQAMTNDDLRDIISFGRTGTQMEGFADQLTVSQIDDAIVFLRSIQ